MAELSVGAASDEQHGIPEDQHAPVVSCETFAIGINLPACYNTG